MKLCVVGGLGFIGTKLLQRLDSAGVSYSVLDKRASIGVFKNSKHLKGDVRRLEDIAEATKGCDTIINLAAEHRDDVRPRSLYDEVNVQGARNLCDAARSNGIKSIIFTSSAAVYGFAQPGTDENGAYNPFNDYGRTKMEAEKVYRRWLVEAPDQRTLTIIRPTVVFGERNRGNVYNLLHQIASSSFMMVGNGRNRKSMAYVENVAAFLEYALSFVAGEHLFNYVDKPDLQMNELVDKVRSVLGKKATPRIKVPCWLGYLGGVVFDGVARITRQTFPISSIRIKKFCSETVFSSTKIVATGFHPPVSLLDGLRRTIRFEFLEKHDEQLFYTE